MKNEETIKTYTDITPLEALKLLVENNGEQVESVSFWNVSKEEWQHSKLSGCNPTAPLPFTSRWGWSYRKCAKVTELDPSKTPEGCPELEPWMAYVGDQPLDFTDADCEFYLAMGGVWVAECGPHFEHHRCIDVRTAWAQENFPEHCRIRNYQEPDAFEEYWELHHSSRNTFFNEGYAREFYELGQSNPK